MPSVVTHAAVAVAAGVAFAPRGVSLHFWSLAVTCSILPDADVLAFSMGIPYHHALGHRGFFHSPFFGLLVSLFVVAVFFRNVDWFSRQWFHYLVFFFLVSASHGVLDAFTNGGLGIALLSPVSNYRYFFPWTPIVVSPIGIREFLSRWGLAVMKSEFLWIWLPCAAVVTVSWIVRLWRVKN